MPPGNGVRTVPAARGVIGPPVLLRPGPCKHGAPLYLAYESARRELAEQRRLDSQPPPGQGTLF